MRKIVALLLVLVIMAGFMIMPALASFGDPSQDTPPADMGNPDDKGGSSSGPVAGTGEKKDFTEPPAAVEETNAAAEETTTPVEETEPIETTTAPTEAPTVAAETTVVTETMEQTQPDPNTVLGVSQQILESSAEQTAEIAPEKDSDSETFLLIALIAGLGAICGVLVIRRVLDV